MGNLLLVQNRSNSGNICVPTLPVTNGPERDVYCVTFAVILRACVAEDAAIQAALEHRSNRPPMSP